MTSLKIIFLHSPKYSSLHTKIIYLLNLVEDYQGLHEKLSLVGNHNKEVEFRKTQLHQKFLRVPNWLPDHLFSAYMLNWLKRYQELNRDIFSCKLVTGKISTQLYHCQLLNSIQSVVKVHQSNISKEHLMHVQHYTLPTKHNQKLIHH